MPTEWLTELQLLIKESTVAMAGRRKRLEAPPLFGRMGEFTAREWETLELIAKGFTREEIADTLRITSTAVRNTITRVYAKLGVNNRKDALLAIQSILPTI